ncbi:glycosyltransferase family 2 protein [Halorubrum sp. Ib24]|uniref:glycosyltransferase family 2 protein n=1 Tax=Halorubrum sp. Ib24 TaxID=1383850 RepID=UPI00117AD269|nr:hypothetical protein [Halorubrum sp. Ib24]
MIHAESPHPRTDEITVATKVFTRTEAFRGLLESIPPYINHVIVADDGHTQSRASIYNSSWDFELNVLDLEYDAGIGVGRDALVDAFDTEFLLMTDPDHRIPPNAHILLEQLIEVPEFGGIAGLLVEDGRVGGYCHDFRNEDGGNILVRCSNDTEVRRIADYPLLEFNFVPQAALVRRDALADYSWDPYFQSAKDHLDFMIGQWDAGWQWGASPSVLFEHIETTDEEYNKSRQDLVSWYKAKEHILNKWEYDQIVSKRNSAAFTDRSLKTAVTESIPVGIQRWLNEAGDIKNLALGRYRA